ncbi:hypothetical protein Scinn_74110 [Streptomyces virginiae]|uniref:Uncharacterized protein n=1 Tax=Streptomyces virginiae TaxID=1961 RepID=A0ABQ3NYV5_STRVG|nr:hypothetical protein Scinn_74110 [Streptomyces virginiae]
MGTTTATLPKLAHLGPEVRTGGCDLRPPCYGKPLVAGATARRRGGGGRPGRPGNDGDYRRSTIVTLAWPPPSHIVWRP